MFAQRNGNIYTEELVKLISHYEYNSLRFSGFIVLTAMEHDTKYKVGFGNLILYEVSVRLTRDSFMAQLTRNE